MKKRCCFMLMIMMILCLTGCTGQDTINDKSTGEVYTGNPSELQDGNYTVTAAYYSPEGYKAGLTIEVHNGILTKATFIETDAAGDPRTEAPADYPESLDTLYNKLITKLIRKQSKTKDIIEGAETISEQFNLLSKAAIKQAETGDSTPVTVNLPATYTITQTWEDDTTSTLIVTFDETDTITECRYNNLDDADEETESRSNFEMMTDLTITANTLDPIELPATVTLTGEVSLTHYNDTLAILNAFRNDGL